VLEQIKTDLEVLDSSASISLPQNSCLFASKFQKKLEESIASFLSNKYLPYPKTIHKTVTFLRSKLSPGLFMYCSLRDPRTCGSCLLSSTDLPTSPGAGDCNDNYQAYKLSSGNKYTCLESTNSKRARGRRDSKQTLVPLAWIKQTQTISACADLGITNFNAKHQSSAYTAPATTLAAKQQKVSHSTFLRAAET